MFTHMFPPTTHLLSAILIAYTLSLQLTTVTSAPSPTSSTNDTLPAAQGTSCTCQSPSGCPGQCVFSPSSTGSSTGEAEPSCANYCGTGTVLPCSPCSQSANGNGTQMEILECIYDFSDGSCFTIS